MPNSKLLIQPHDEGVSVRFPCGGTAEIFPTSEKGRVGFDYKGRPAGGLEVTNPGWLFDTVEQAIEAAWCELATEPPPVAMSEADVHKLAREADLPSVRASKLFEKTVKRFLFERTGMTFAVRAGAGVQISVKGRKLLAAERVMLSSIFGPSDVTKDGMDLPPCNRVRILSLAAGVDLPDWKPE